MPRPTLYFSSQVRGAVKWLTTASASGAVIATLAASFGPSCGLVQAAAGLFAGVGLVCAGVLWVGRTEQSHCVFCGKPQAEVRWLVAGPATSICEECIGLSMGIVCEREPMGWTRLADALPALCPWKVSGAVIEAAVALDPSPRGLRKAAAAAFRAQNAPLAARLLADIPEGAREGGDWVDLGTAWMDEGRYDDATVAMRAARDEASRPRALMGIAWCAARQTAGSAYRSSTVVPKGDAERWLRGVDEAVALLEKTRPAGWEATRRAALGVRAAIQRLCGDLDAALFTISGAGEPFTAGMLLCRARVHADKGQTALALPDVKKALALFHPESREAAEARELLATLEGRTAPARASP